MYAVDFEPPHQKYACFRTSDGLDYLTPGGSMWVDTAGTLAAEACERLQTKAHEMHRNILIYDSYRQCLILIVIQYVAKTKGECEYQDGHVCFDVDCV